MKANLQIVSHFRQQRKKISAVNKISTDGLKEISKLLAQSGTVAGKGEKIDRKLSKKSSYKNDAVNHFELPRTSVAPDQLAAQLISRLENHKRHSD